MWFCSLSLHVVESRSLPSDLTWLSLWPVFASRLWKKMQRMPALSLAPRGHGHVDYLYCSPSFSISWWSLVLNKNRLACWKMRGHVEQSQASSVVPSGPRKSLPKISKATLMTGSWRDRVPMPSKTTQPSWWLLRREGILHSCLKPLSLGVICYMTISNIQPPWCIPQLWALTCKLECELVSSAPSIWHSVPLIT